MDDGDFKILGKVEKLRVMFAFQEELLTTKQNLLFTHTPKLGHTYQGPHCCIADGNLKSKVDGSNLG